MKSKSKEAEVYDDLARKLAAAFISYRLGYKGVDPVLKQLQDQEISPSWTLLAEFVNKNAISPVDSTFKKAHKKTHDQIASLFQGFTKNPFN